MDDEDLYDEFGNYIGPEEEEDEAAGAYEDAGPRPTGAQYLDEDFDLENVDDEAGDGAAGPGALVQIDDEDGASNQIVLHEDKHYYPSAAEVSRALEAKLSIGKVYGEDVEAVVHEEDTQPLTEPIVQPIKVKKFTFEEDDLPATTFSREFMLDLMSVPELVRNVAVIGHLHHGKTSFLDMLVLETHSIKEPARQQLRYTDTHVLERQREMSIKCAPISMVLQNGRGKSHLLHLIDCPGHVDFSDEASSAMQLADGVVLVVDAVEGVMLNARRSIKHAVLHNLPITLVINKVDRLIMELRIPPEDAYYKLKHVIEDVNTAISAVNDSPELRISPERGNVLFASAKARWCFTLESFARLYMEHYGGNNAPDFAMRLWGDVFYNPEARNFSRKRAESGSKRSFVHFVLEPVYKLYAHTIGESQKHLSKMLEAMGISLKASQYKLDPQELLKLVCHQFFGGSSGFVDMVTRHIPSASEATPKKIDDSYTGPSDSDLTDSMRALDTSDGSPLVVQVVKLFNTSDAKDFIAFGRVYSGVLRKNQRVRVLGQSYSVDDEEDMVTTTVTDVWVPGGRYKVPTNGVPAGNLVLLGGVSTSISKSATIVSEKTNDDASIFKPVAHFSQSVFKVAVEPINPSELPKMLDGLRRINTSYPALVTKVEESGEHVILGTGEMYMDCALYDLRRLYSEIEIKVSDPVVRFTETVLDTSSLKCYARTPNKKNRITMIAEPLDQGVAEDIESGAVSVHWPVRKLGQFFEEKYSWDILAARSIWAFGPGDDGPNILQDDTLESEVDKKLLRSVRDSIKQGFQWGAREGPLCEEPVRNANFKIMDVSLAPEPIYRGGGQIIPTVRRVCYSSLLTASPRLMEPVYLVEVLAPADCVQAVYTVLQRRRGHVTKEQPQPGTPLYLVTAQIPVIDSFGFETDLRAHTQGQAFCQQVFDHWQIVPGDPLDKDIRLHALEAAPAPALARDFMLKTRRRKGLVEDVSVSQFFDEDMLENLRKTDIFL